METQRYIDQKKKLYTDLLLFIENNEYDDDTFNQLIENIKTCEVQCSRDEIDDFIRLIINISNNHQRSTGFFDKIKRILLFLRNDIKNFFSNQEIFQIFESNKILLLFLIKEKIITYDEYVNKFLENKAGNDDILYFHFFLPEIIEFKSNETNSRIKFEDELKKIEKYEEKRQIGENDSYICELIRQDSIEEFIIYVNQKNLLLTSKINRSIFETNSFLIENEPTLIEYTFFFGSIQIFQYLKTNGVDLTPSLWLYAIHSKNAEMIYFLEENSIQPPENSYEICIIEAIKCNHNDIGIYIKDNLLNDENSSNKLKKRKKESIYRYSNYSYFPEKFDQIDFFYLCQYNYIKLVDFYLKDKNDYIMSKIILKYFFFHQILTEKLF